MSALQKSLIAIIEQHAVPNPALRHIIDDYSRYHAILALLSGILSISFICVGFYFFRKTRNARIQSKTRWSFETKSYCYFFIISCVVGLCMLLLAIANLTNTFDPIHGLSLAYNLSNLDGAVSKETYSDSLHQVFSAWIESGQSSMPNAISIEIAHRIRFHETKALLSFFLLLAFGILSINKWKVLICSTKSIAIEKGNRKGRLFRIFDFVLANVSLALSLLMLLVVMANIQGAFAPLTAFLVGFY